jgi:ABC-2 type transport system ATP-binding protein
VERIADELILIGRGKIVAQGTKADLLQTRGTLVRAVDQHALVVALQHEGVPFTAGDDGVRSEAEPADIGWAAARHQVALVELRPAEGEGLEEMFLQLTSDTQRDILLEGATA